ncbi:DUF3566 domain-containing protein [Corynebacterium phoceense]|uniref:DUF3566 domain-containing protein n=1 Tax=Corynebacterium TaxID=1716 RepID=UPI000797243F|nr:MULTISPECIES: DUF3566 domain-containing protein [Corynebacterium]KXI16187.1 hypothetical protein HMPREF3227_02135 [Corynebacterium sp. CMW7794]MBF9011491.1 DUF3566 domain-containing protein [Corynebacterium phoceense]MCQ9331383.1 DUF3566 domain-containing protein [Corynebacterium phoceense]MCQ9336198.1 DUF3566 domain-containing protein [Corynebacterium phoceense]MCQ9348270.1 DUF3566 domain-containing protein [Corynebacterium phoceense]
MARRDVTLKRIAPLSAFRVGLAFSLIGLVAWLLALCLVWFGMDMAGVWDSLNSLIGDVGGGITITFGMVLSIGALFGAIMAVLMTILAPLLAVMYNAVVDLFGGFVLRLTDY